MAINEVLFHNVISFLFNYHFNNHKGIEPMEITKDNAIFSIEIKGKPYLFGIGQQFVEMAKDEGLTIPNHLDPIKFYILGRDQVFTEVNNVKIKGKVE